MSTLPASDARPLISSSFARVSPQHAAALAALLSILGVTAIWPTVLFLWSLWTTDALKSVGMIIPLVSLILILRVWRTLGWEMDGTWWGAALLALTIAVVRLREQSVLVFMVTLQWSVYVPPHSLVVFAYASGAVLFFGGTRLYRAAWFPIALLWLVNPVPHIFNVFVDLPLQRISAHVARGFAMALGQPLSPDQMRLMFTPQFGMFIAPGCNGIRGAVTMGLIALVAGYIYRFRFRAHAAVVAGAILLGYVFNFARLCLLVLFYLVALRLPWLQNKAKLGDYIIGACLFFFATYLLFHIIRSLGDSVRQIRPLPAPAMLLPSSASSPLSFRFAAMLVFVLLGCVRLSGAILRNRAVSASDADQNALGRFPSTLGAYTLSRSWNEYLPGGPLIFHWADYAPADGGTHIAIGLFPVLGSHDTLICHSARGEDPLWHGQFTIPTALAPINFSGSFFNNGATQYLEASTLCNGATCGESSTAGTHLGFVYSRPDASALITQDPERSIPILLRAETIDTTLSTGVARDRLATSLRSFLASVNLESLTQPYRRQ
jgi:exosortase J